ncbi:hypothetical protein EDB83DRAFT_1749211 [Lactarius deliciosus]|nr:hypothetical protein EDB83DRAFT_1749211 [Lactarius deliciosus]
MQLRASEALFPEIAAWPRSFISSPIDMTSSLKARTQIYSKAEKDCPIRVPFITTASRSPARYTPYSPLAMLAVLRANAGHDPCSRGKCTTHDGIKVEFVGNIELFYDRWHHQEFLSLSQEVAAPGDLRQAQTCDHSQYEL